MHVIAVGSGRRVGGAWQQWEAALVGRGGNSRLGYVILALLMWQHLEP